MHIAYCIYYIMNPFCNTLELTQYFNYWLGELQLIFELFKCYLNGCCPAIFTCMYIFIIIIIIEVYSINKYSQLMNRPHIKTLWYIRFLLSILHYN